MTQTSATTDLQTSATTELRVRPGEVLARGPGYVWLAYELDTVIHVACYVLGHLLQRDNRGWYVAGLRGEWVPVAGDPEELLRGTHPDGWPVVPWQEELREERHEQPAHLLPEGSWL